MKRKLLIITLLFAAIATAQPKKRVVIGGGADPERTKDWPQAAVGVPAFEKFLDEMAARDLFSGTVLIARGNETVLQKSYGLADKKQNIANKIGRASCRKECRSRWSPYHEKKNIRQIA